MIQQPSGPRHPLFNTRTLGSDIPRVLERLPSDSIKIYGSSLLSSDFADIDIAVSENDTSTMAYLLHHAPRAGFHPIVLRQSTFDNLHNLLSWKNCLMTADKDGAITYGTQFFSGGILQFNPASRTAFPDFISAVRAAEKMEKRGYILPASEKARAILHLRDSVRALGTIAREALTDQVMYLLAAHGAIVAGGFFRDEIDGRPPKDVDVFVPAGQGWSELCDEITKVLEEVKFDIPSGSRVNLRKFRARSQAPGHECLVIDVIDYSFVHEAKHVVETFDFRCNCLWWDPQTDEVSGGMGASPADILEDIRLRRLIVGDNMWYRAGLYRALKRWQRFRGDGYVADAENVAKYSEYVKHFAGQ